MMGRSQRKYNVVHFPMHHDMKKYEGVKEKLHTFWTAALERDEWSGFMLWPSYPLGKSTHCTMDRRMGGFNRGDEG